MIAKPVFPLLYRVLCEVECPVSEGCDGRQKYRPAMSQNCNICVTKGTRCRVSFCEPRSDGLRVFRFNSSVETKMFNSKIKFLPKRLGERYASALINKNLSNKMYKYFGKINLKDYVNNFILK